MMHQVYSSNAQKKYCLISWLRQKSLFLKLFKKNFIVNLQFTSKFYEL